MLKIKIVKNTMYIYIYLIYCNFTIKFDNTKKLIIFSKLIHFFRLWNQYHHKINLILKFKYISYSDLYVRIFNYIFMFYIMTHIVIN